MRIDEFDQRDPLRMKLSLQAGSRNSRESAGSPKGGNAGEPRRCQETLTWGAVIDRGAFGAISRASEETTELG